MQIHDDINRVYEMLEEGVYPEEYHMFVSEMEDIMVRVEDYIAHLESIVRKMDKENKKKKEDNGECI